MRRLFAIAVGAAALSVAGTGLAHPPPITPEGQIQMERREAIEELVRKQFSKATLERVRDMFGQVIVADEVNGRPTNLRVLIKDEYGWHELQRGKLGRVPERVAHEFDRLLIDESIANENAYVHDVDCPKPRLFILEHAEREQFGRQCAPAGISGRIAEVAATFRVPRAPEIAPPPDDARPGPRPGENFGRYVSHRARAMVYAWQRRSLAGAVDAYADDAIVELADGRVLKGKKAIVDWLRPQQNWATPGVFNDGMGKQVQYHRGLLKPPQGDFVQEAREIRWEENGRPLRRTYSATWRNNDGLWEIVHEKVSADKPATDERQRWY